MLIESHRTSKKLCSILILSISTYCISSSQGNARQDSSSDSKKFDEYKETCSFIERQINAAIFIVNNESGSEKGEFIRKFNGSNVYQMRGKDVYIQYIKTADGRTLIEKFEINSKWLARSGQGTAVVAKELHMTRPMPMKFNSECDAYSVLVHSKKGEISKIEISANFID
jgi:hypothetical protein